jgi:hypothetical protein
MKKPNTSTGVTEKMMKEMFARLLNIEVSSTVMEKLVPVIDGVSEKMQGDFRTHRDISQARRHAIGIFSLLDMLRLDLSQDGFGPWMAHSQRAVQMPFFLGVMHARGKLVEVREHPFQTF